MPTRTEVLGDGTIGGKEPLGLTRRLKPLHAPLALPSGLMGIVKLSEGIAPSAGLQNRACRRIGCQRVTQSSTFPTALLQTARESFDLKSAFQLSTSHSVQAIVHLAPFPFQDVANLSPFAT